MERLRRGLFKILVLLIINVMLIPVCLPVSKIFATNKSEFTLTTSDTRTSFSAGDTLILNLNLVSAQYGVTAISGTILFDNSLVDIDCFVPDSRVTQRRWESPTYTDGFMSQFAKDASSGSTTSECIQEIELTFKRSASLSSVGLLLKDFEVAYAGLSGSNGQDKFDVSYGDVSALISEDDDEERKLSLVPDEQKDSYSAGDIIVLTLYLNKTDRAITSIVGNLTYDSTLVEINGEDDDGEYLYYIDSPGRTSAWDTIANDYNPSTKEVVIRTKNNQLVSDSGEVQIIEFIVKQNTDYINIGFENIFFSEGLDRYEAVCTPYVVGTPPTPAVTHQVTYDYGTNGGHKDGAVSTTTETANVAEGSSIPFPNGAKTDYTFVGWNTDPTAHTALTSLTMETEDVTLYAIYCREIEVRFKGCNRLVQEDLASQTAKFYNNEVDSEPVTFPEAHNYVKDGVAWVHRGWKNTTSTDPEESNALLVAERAPQSIKVTDTQFYMLYENTVTITYNLNGNNDTYGSAPSLDSGNIYLNSYSIGNLGGYAPIIKDLDASSGRRGYTISKWNTQQDGSGIDYTIGVAPATGFTTSTTLYAQWTPNTDTPYKIKYFKQNPNDLSHHIEVTEDEQTLTATTGTTVTVTPDSNKYGAGYEYDSSLSHVSETLQAANASNEPTTVLQVYYKLKTDRTYTVVRHVEDGNNPGTYNVVPGNEIYDGYAGQSVTAPSKASDYPGYDETNPLPSGIVSADNSLVLDVNYTARTDTPYVVEYYLQNYDGSWPTEPDSRYTENLTGRTGATVYIPGNLYKGIPGYQYASNENEHPSDTIKGDGSTELKLYYEAINTPYKVEHYIQDANGQYVRDDSETEIITDQKTGTPVTATPKQTILDNGYVENTIHQSRVVSGNITGDGNLTLKVYYKKLIEVSLDSNDGTNTEPTKVYVPLGEAYGIENLPSLIRTGYDHNSRWTKVANDESTMVSSTDIVNGPHTLYAYWTLAEYTVTLNNQEATTSGTENVKEKYSDGIYMGSNLMTTTDNPIETPAKNGYTFGGYYTAENGSGTKMIDENGYITENFTSTYFTNEEGVLYANWLEKTQVNFDKRTNDTSVQGYTMESKEVVVGQPYGELLQLTRRGYQFAGWFPAIDGDGNATGTEVTSSTIVTEIGHHTIYAKWTPKTDTPYEVRYYKQNLNDLSNYIEVIEDRQPLTGTTGTTVSVTPDPDKYGPGYECNTTPISAILEPEKEDGTAKTILEVKYNLKGDRAYIVHRHIEDGNNTGTNTYITTVTDPEPYYGFTGQEVTAPSKAGEYAGYTEIITRDKGGIKTLADTNDDSNPLELDVYYDTLDVDYKIVYFLQNYDGSWPESSASQYTDTRTGKTGATVDISSETHKNIPGYQYASNENEHPRDTIKGDGSTELKLYYEAINTPYKVEHYIQDANGQYVRDDSETEIITDQKTGTPVTATPKQTILARGDGFIENTEHEDRKVSGNVTATENPSEYGLTLKLYYSRLITVTLDRNDGTNTTTTFQVIYGTGYGSDNLINLTRRGCSHNNRWTKTVNDLTTQVSATDAVTEPHTLYAYWTPGEYVITLDNQSATTPGTESLTEVYEHGIYIGEVNASNLMEATNNPITIPEKTAYAFRGYYTLTDGNGLEMIDENGYITSNFINTYYISAGTLYAKWVEKPTVYFDKRTDDPLVEGYTMESKEVVYGEPYGDIPQLTRKGYIFGDNGSGWYPRLDMNGNPSGTPITSDTIVAETGIHTVYAKWEAKTYKIYFEKNINYQLQANLDAIDVTFDQPYANLPDLTGALGESYTFGGWYRGTGDGNGNVTGEQVNSSDIVKRDSNETLYAKWIPKPVSVVFKYIEPATENPEDYPEGIEKSVTMSFDYNTRFNRNMLIQSLSEQGLNITDVTENSDGTPKTFQTPKYTYTVNGTQSLNMDELSRQSGYLIDDVTTISVNYNTEIRKYDVTFYDEDKTTQWDIIRNINYGDYADNSTVQDPTKNPDNLNRYVFNKWLNKEDDTPVTFPYEITGPLEVYAQYTAIKIDYTITFLDEDRTVLDMKDDCHYGDLIQVPQDPTKPATQQYTYTFDHWVDGEGNELTSSELRNSTVSGDKTYTAVYNSVVNKYTVKFYNETGDTLLDEDEVDYGTNAMWNRNGDKETPAKEPSNGYTYTFENNWVKQDRQTEDDLSNVIEDRDVYVKFTPIPIIYNIRYGYLLGATNNPNPTTYTVETPDIVLEPLGDRPGLTFLGWCADLECLEPITTIETSRKEDVIVYANWDVEDIMYFAKSAQDTDNNDQSVMVFRDFEEAKDYVDTIFDNGNGQAIGLYDLKNDLVYFPRTLYYVKASADVDNENAIQYNSFDEAKDYVIQEFTTGTVLGIYDKKNNLIFEPTAEQEPVIVEVVREVVKYYVKDSAEIDNEQATEYDEFNTAKNYVDTLFAQGTTTRIYDSDNKLVYEPHEDPEPEIVEIEVVKYYVKDSAEIDNEQATEYEEFNDAKTYVDTLFAQGTTTRVYDSNNKLVYEPHEEQEPVVVEIPVVKYYVKDSAEIENENAMEFEEFNDAKNHVDTLFAQGTRTGIKVFDTNNNLVYEPHEEPEPVVLEEVKYYVKVNASDENTDENTFDLFSAAKSKADEQAQSGVKVYDTKGEIVYEPQIEEPIEDLYLRTLKYKIGENNTSEYQAGDIYLYRVDPYLTLSDFMRTCVTNGEISVYKQTGEKLKNNEYVGTGMVLRCDKDQKYIILMLSIKGDLDGNGKITATDLAAMKQESIRDIRLTGARQLSADINNDKFITPTDLATINQAILKQLDLKSVE